MGRKCAFTAKVLESVSWKPRICERSCCLFSGDQSPISNFVSICSCGRAAGFFNQGVHLPRRSVLDQLVIIEGVHEVMSVDAQLTRTNAESVYRKSKRLKSHSLLSILPMSTPIISWSGGLSEAYPKARIIASAAVVDRINKVYQEKIDKWKKVFGSGATSHVAAIGTLDGNFIQFESSQIEVLKNIQGDNR